MNKRGKIVIPQDADFWPHEIKTARALSNAGYVVEFIERRKTKGEQTADIKMDGKIWEMKSPKSSKLRRTERVIRDAIHQSKYVIYDSQRVKVLNDNQIYNELIKCADKINNLRGLIFVTKKREVIVIK